MEGHTEETTRARCLICFDQWYSVLADLGQADAPGSMEYRRVRREFRREGCPGEDIRAFIRQRTGAYTPPPQ